MEFYMKLPRSKKEFVLFIGVISILSVNIIAPIITCFELGFHLEVWADTLRVIPFIWLSVVVLVLLTYRPAEWMTGQIVDKDDSFNAHIVVNILCTVFLMSIFLTVIGTWIGSRQVSLEPIRLFFTNGPAISPSLLLWRRSSHSPSPVWLCGSCMNTGISNRINL